MTIEARIDDHAHSSSQPLHLTRRSAVTALGLGLAAGTGRLATSADAQPATPPPTPTSVPPIVAHWVAAWEAGDGTGVAALFTEDGLYEDLAFEAYNVGHEEVGQWVTITTHALSAIRAEVVHVVQGDGRIAFEWVFSGEQTGPFPGDIPATGRAFSVRALSTFEMEGDLIRHASDFYNLATLFRQLGLPVDGYVPAGPLATPVALEGVPMTIPTSIDETAPVIARHEIDVAAPLATVWSLHTDVSAWPNWQSDIDSATIGQLLAPGVTFTWSTFGLDITSTVYAAEEPYRTLWGGPTQGIDGIHEWRFSETPGGVHVVTNESWSGSPVEADRDTLQGQLDASLMSWLQHLKVAAETVS